MDMMSFERRMAESYESIVFEVANVGEIIQTMTEHGDDQYHPHENWYWSRREKLMRSSDTLREYLRMMKSAMDVSDGEDFTQLFLETTEFMRTLTDVLDEIVEKCDG